MNKFFAALMTLIILVTVVVVFALGVLSITGGVGESNPNADAAASSSTAPDK